MNAEWVPKYWLFSLSVLSGKVLDIFSAPSYIEYFFLYRLRSREWSFQEFANKFSSQLSETSAPV
jgi:hypothetical protein